MSEAAANDSNSCDINEAKVDGFRSLLGPNMDMLASWDSNGLTSLLHAELISRVQESHQVTLPIHFQLEHQTPDQLKRFIESSTSKLFPVTLPNLDEARNRNDSRESLRLSTMTLLQTLGIAFVILIFAACLIPAYFVGKNTSHMKFTFEVGLDSRLVVFIGCYKILYHSLVRCHPPQMGSHWTIPKHNH